ncbi:hypothetical protein Fcan01_22080 [Folsomia candida]|uniref:Ubiquitin-like protease family profile domain-containing protein n=1 Tax=Folsomia candida TaxID=158441 RepID=A0A226DBX4_FOLCA|nr:hypothetical protein Fcan01_22080 [Folsomia candida]
MEALNVFDETDFGFTGVETEILSLAPNTCVTSGIAMPYALKIMQDCIIDYQDQKKKKLVSGIIYHSNHNDKMAPVPIFTTSPVCLPNEGDFDDDWGILYTVIFFKVYAFLVEMDFAKHKIRFMDSLADYLSQVQKKAIFNAIRDVLRERYSIVDWVFENKGSARQGINDCVILSLMNLKARLLDLDHMLPQHVNLYDAGEYRDNMIEELMKTTDIGSTFFAKCKSSKAVLNQINRREVQRKKIFELLTKRNLIAKIYNRMENIQAQLDDGTTNPYFTQLEVRLHRLQGELEKDVEEHELDFARNRALRNSQVT